MKRNIITIIFTLLIIYVMFEYSPKQSVTQTIDVITVRPQTKNIYDYVNANGRIKEANKRDIYINGVATVTEVFVNVGDVVEKNDVLAKIKTISDENDTYHNYNIDTSGIIGVFEDYGVEMDFDSNNSTSKIIIGEEESVIKSPIDGTVTSVNIKAGDSVSALHKLISVSDFSDLYIDALIPEEYALQISEGKNAEISAEAFGDITYRGVIENVYPVAKYVPSVTGDGKTYIEAVISIENPNDMLRPELTVNTKITANTVNNAITIPYECIMQDDNNREFVFCIEDGFAKKRFINVGYELDSEVQIEEGVTTRDTLILNPSEEIKENMKVREITE